MLIDPFNPDHGYFYVEGEGYVLFDPDDPECMQKYRDARLKPIEEFQAKLEQEARTPEDNGTIDLEKTRNRKQIGAVLDTIKEVFKTISGQK